jgi:RES domain
VLYRVFPQQVGAGGLDEGGPLFVARSRQGTGRHDNPGSYGALYLARLPESAVAELLRGFLGRIVRDVHLRRPDGSTYALAMFDDSTVGEVVDLDDPLELVRLGLKPSEVATRDREVTQQMALTIFGEGGPGLGWWSTIEASWPNVTLFAERAVGRLVLAETPVALSIRHPMVLAAAELLGIRLAG